MANRAHRRGRITSHVEIRRVIPVVRKAVRSGQTTKKGNNKEPNVESQSHPTYPTVYDPLYTFTAAIIGVINSPMYQMSTEKFTGSVDIPGTQNDPRWIQPFAPSNRDALGFTVHLIAKAGPRPHHPPIPPSPSG